MKKIVLLSIFILAGCVLVAGCFTQTIKNTDVEKSISPTTTSSIHAATTYVMQGGVPVRPGISKEIKRAQLNVSIGDFPAKLPVQVFIDNQSADEVSQGKPRSLMVSEGRHTIKVCADELCEQVDVEIKYAIKTTIDFGERLKNNIPQGLLNVSNISIENKTDVLRGPLTVSIGGYDAELPVFIDNWSVGVVSFGKPLKLMLEEGRHKVEVCVGLICENESVEVKFAQQTSVEFGERLKRDVEFPTPTVRILNSFHTANTLYIDVEFINPDKTDHTMSTSIRCVYSYNDDSRIRQNDFAEGQITTLVKAGERKTQRSSIYLPGGRNIITTEPVLIDVSIK